MREDFDPYRKWLGIPPAEQPPDHYRLLGVGRFEDDADTIDSAADRQMAHVRTFQAGPHSALSQKLLNEIAAARVCLLGRAKKAEYDARLKAKLAEYEARMQARPASQAAAPAAPVAMPVPQPSPVDELTAPVVVSRPVRRKKKSPVPALAAGGAVLLLVVVVAIVLFNGGKTPENTQRVAPKSTVRRPSGPSAPKDGLAGRPTEALAPPANGSPPSSDDKAIPAPAVPPSEARLEIVEAAWGTGDRWQDMTQRVQELVEDGRLLATAWASFYAGIRDPAFGVQKQLRLRYRAGGELRSGEFADGDFIYLDARPAEVREPSSKGLELLEARYGAGMTWIDVLPRLRRWIHGDRLGVRANLVATTDPVPNVSKALFLRYRTLDGEFVCHAWDGEELVLDARPVAATGQPVDLIAAANADRDSTGGKWRKEGAVLVAPDGESGSLPIAVEAADDYLLTAVLAARPRPDNVNVTLPIADRYVQLVVDGWLGRAGRAVGGLQSVDGAMANQNETTRRGRFFESGQATTIQCAVRKSSIFAKCNGRVVVDWSGDVQRLSVPNKPDGNERSLVVGGLGSPWRIERLQVASLAAAPPRAAPASDEVVDLLKLIDTALDAVRGEWQMTDKGLLSPVAEWMRLGVPYLPPDDYELRVVAARQEGNDALGIGLVVDGRQTEAVVDGWGGNTRGLNGLDGESYDRNASTNKGSVFVDDQPKELVCTVHPDSIRVVSGGQTLMDWHGDARRFSSKSDVPDQLALQLMTWKTKFLISKLELRPLPPEKPEPPLNLAQPPAPADLVDKPAADNRRPVPQGKELAAAQKQVTDTYNPQWKAAKKLPEQQALARKMYDDGVQTLKNSVMRYALLREAERRASDLGDAATACEAIDQLGRDFRIDTLAEKLAAAGDALKKAQSPTQLWTLALCVSVLADGALVAERYDEAKKLLSLLALAGPRLRRNDLKKYADRRLAVVRSRQDWHNRLEKALARLKEDADDPAANLTAGIGCCLLRGDWKRGLPLLARSGDKRMVEIARLEPAANQDAAQRPALVDGWLAEAPNQSGAMRTEYELQAKYWLERGLPDQAPADSAHKRAFDKLAAMPGISLARLKPGLDMAMYNGADFQQFRARRVAEEISHDFGFKSPHPSVRGDDFSIRWTGWLKPPLPGKYVIRTNSDDGCRLRINGKLLVDRWHRGAGEERAEVELTDQLQPISLEFNDTGVTASVRVAWALKDVSDFQPLPAEVFYHDPASVAEK